MLFQKSYKTTQPVGTDLQVCPFNSSDRSKDLSLQFIIHLILFHTIVLNSIYVSFFQIPPIHLFPACRQASNGGTNNSPFVKDVGRGPRPRQDGAFGERTLLESLTTRPLDSLTPIPIIPELTVSQSFLSLINKGKTVPLQLQL